MNIENISIRRKDYEMQLQDAIDNKNETIDSKVEQKWDTEINFLIDQIKLYKKWEKILEKYEEGDNDFVNYKNHKKRIDIAIRLLIKLFGTDDYEINYIIGILNGQRQIDFEEEKSEGNN